MIERIGFIGLGIMGKPMARNLMKAGFPLVVHNRSRGPVDELAAEGATPASSPREASEGADAVITMLPDDAIVEEVVLGTGGVMEGMRKGAVLVDMTTVSPMTARTIAATLEQSGMEMLDAPVSGGKEGATEGTLSIMVGGKADVFQCILPAFQAMGKNITHIGDHGAGQVAKAANQIVVALTLEAVAEALIFSQKSGVDPKRVREALLGGYAHSRVLEVHGKRMVERDFRPGGRVRFHKKDIEIVIAMARELGMYLPATALISHLWNAVAAQGGLEWDHSSVIKVLELMSKTEVCPT